MDNSNELFTYFINEMGEYSSIKKFGKNELIFNEDEYMEYIYIVISGKVEVFKLTKSWDERLLFILHDGEILNDDLLYSKTTECVTCCRAYTNVKVMSIKKEILLKQIEKDKKIMEYVFSSMSLKLTRTYRQLKNSGTNVTIDKKIASKLWKLALDYGFETKNGIYIDLTLSSSIISKMVGAKRETVSRCLNKFKKEGILEISGDRIIVINNEELKQKFQNN